MASLEFRFIKSCNDCPMANQEESFCQHPDAPGEYEPGAFKLSSFHHLYGADGSVETVFDPPPAGCPLRKGALALSLDPKAP